MIRYICLALLVSAAVNLTAWAELTSDIAIADFTTITKSSEIDEHTQSIPTLISTRLSRKLPLVMRLDLGKILNEMGLPELGIVDPKTAAQIGHFVGARHIFTGQLSSFQGKSGMRIRITTQLVDVETARVIGGWQIAASPTELDIQAIKLADKILKVLFPVSTWGAAGRSLLIPGWGQFANDRSSGYAFLPLAIAGLGGLVAAQYAYTQANDDYEEIQGRERKTYAELQQAEDKRDDRKTLRLIAAGAVAVVWLVNIADASWKARILNKQKQHAESRTKVEARVEPQSVQIIWAARF